LVGVFAGAQFEKKAVSRLLAAFLEQGIRNSPQAGLVAAQFCGPDSVNPLIFGIIAGSTENFASIQDAMRRWNDAECLTSTDTSDGWTETVEVVPGNTISVGPRGAVHNSSSEITKRATCQYTQVVAGDGCWAVSNRCGISQAQLESYNPRPNFCGTLIVGEYVCCSAGELPDFSPQPNPDGSCRTYTVQAGDYCLAIATANSMEVSQIEDRNGNTWGWMGCNYLIVGSIICLSTGDPPMPAPVANAVCGPQVPGTEKPEDMSTLIDLNPCPLNACCNVWGQCGITEQFCIIHPSDTGAPGTAEPGSNGCISSCGVEIVNNNNPPGNFMRVGYFEAFNLERPCLHMLVKKVPFPENASEHATHFFPLKCSLGISVTNTPI
jgi:chitinase